MNNVLEHVSEVLTQKPVELEVDIIPKNSFYRYLQRWKLKPVKKRFVIRPINFGNLIRISKLLLSIDSAIFDKTKLLESSYHAIHLHAETVAKVVAIAIHNHKDEPPPSLVKFVLFNFTSHEMLSTMSIVLQQMNVTGFMTTIISIRGLSVLESGMSPADQGSQIAPGI